MFGEEPPHQQSGQEAKDSPEEDEEANTHQEAGPPARLSQVLRHHHFVIKQKPVSQLSKQSLHCEL